MESITDSRGEPQGGSPEQNPANSSACSGHQGLGARLGLERRLLRFRDILPLYETLRPSPLDLPLPSFPLAPSNRPSATHASFLLVMRLPWSFS